MQKQEYLKCIDFYFFFQTVKNFRGTQFKYPKQLMGIVLVCMGYSNKILQIAQLTKLEAGSLRLACQQGWVEALFLSRRLRMCPYMVKAQESSLELPLEGQ